MENKQVVSSGEITKNLIISWILWGIPCGIVYSFVMGIASNAIGSSIIMKAIVALLLQGITAIIIWKLSTSTSFKTRTISYNDVPKVMKNLIIFTIIICIIDGVYNYATVNSTFDKSINSNSELKLRESMMSSMYTNEQIAKYNKVKENAINDAKSKLNTYLAILEVGIFVVYLGVLPIERKEILKNVC